MVKLLGNYLFTIFSKWLVPVDLIYHGYQFTWVDHTDMAGKQLKIKGDNDEFLQVKENKIVSLTEFLF